MRPGAYVQLELLIAMGGTCKAITCCNKWRAEDSCELVILGGFEAERFGKFSRGGSEPESVGVVGDDVIDGGEGAA